MLAEVQDVLNSHFSSVSEAFEFFVSNDGSLNSLRKEIGFSAFKASLNSLLPKRFNINEINWLWNRCSASSEIMDYSKFIIEFDSQKFTGPKRSLSINKYR